MTEAPAPTPNPTANFYTIVGRILNDPIFASKLLESPQAALTEVGITPTEEMLAAWKNLDAETLTQIATAFGAEDDGPR